MKITLIKVKEEKIIKIIKDVNEENYWLVRKKLDLQRENILNVLRKLKEEGEIKSLSKPKNKKIQSRLNNLISIKRQLDDNINSIKILFS